MRALLVVDVDSGDGWSDNIRDLDGDRLKVGRAIQEVLSTERSRGTLIIFIVLYHKYVSGQESQTSLGERDPKQTPGDEIPFPSAGSCLVCGLGNGKLAAFLEHRHEEPFEPAFVKATGNAFTNHKLAPYLRSLGVAEVVLVGCNTFSCLMDTAVGAAGNGFSVTLLRSGAFPVFSSDGYTEKAWLKSVRQDVPQHYEDTVSVRIE